MKIRPSAATLAVAAAFSPLLSMNAAAADATAEAVVVTATRQPVRASEVLADVTVIEREQIVRSGASNIVDLLGRQPGIQFGRHGGPGTAANIYIRGANADQTKVLIDGMPINTISLSGSPLHQYSLDDVERIEIVRGAASAVYGADAIGGVINVVTRRGRPGLAVDGHLGLGSNNTRRGDVGLSGGDERWRFRVHGNTLRSDGISARREASNQDADDDAYRNEGGGVSLSFAPVAGHEIGATYLEQSGTSHYDSFSAAGDFEDRVRFDNSVWAVYLRNQLAEGWRSTLNYGRAEERTRNHDASVPQGDRQRTRNEQLSWQHDVSLPLGSLMAVVERLEQRVDPTATFARNRFASNGLGLGWTAALGAHSWQLNIRRDDHDHFGAETTGGASYGYAFAPDWRLSLGLSRAYKAPSIDQLYNTAWGYGNPDLQPEDGFNRELALSWDNGVHSASATLYRNTIRDLITYDYATWAYDNVDRAQLQGLTLAYGLNVDAWTVTASFDWLDARNETTDRRLGRRAKESFKLDVQRSVGKADLGVEWLLVGSRYDASNETGRMGGYGVVNLTAAWRLAPEWRLEARVDNLFDKDYQIARGYSTPGLGAFVGVRYSPR